MKLEHQVCRLDIAKRLKELGVKQESLFWWDEGDGIEDRLEYSPNVPLTDLISAFTVAELLDIAPASTSLLKRTDVETNSIPRYYVETFEHYRESDWEENPANAIGKMLIYLLEHHSLDTNQKER